MSTCPTGDCPKCHARRQALSRVQALAFDLLKQADECNEQLSRGEEFEKRRIATLLNDIIEEAGNT